MSVLRKIRLSLISFALVFLSAFSFSTPVFADPTPVTPSTESTTSTSETTQSSTSNTTSATSGTSSEASTDVCYDESGSLGWLVCPSTGFLARITDGLYNLISDYLVLDPIFDDSSSPYHQVWAIFRDLTNVIFGIFILVVIYSQVTGLGISNYGIKKALPKIILSAILINLSYPICALLVDLSNIAGASLRGLFSGVESQVVATGLIASAEAGSVLSYSDLVAALAGSTILGGVAIGAAGGLGYVFLTLVSVLIGAVVAVVAAFLSVAARRALVYLLIMISPLAFVCLLLPNTEKWFDQWKKTLSQMLIFYPMFAALFGACSLIGWVIIAAAERAEILVLGMAVKVIPLVFSWSLLKMSGTIPGQVNSIARNLLRGPAGAAQRGLGAQAGAARARYLGGTAKSYQYNRHLAQYMENRRIRLASDTQKYLGASKLRGDAYATKIHNRSGRITNRGVEIAEINNSALEYQAQIVRTANMYERGLSGYTTSEKQRARLSALDYITMESADKLYMDTTNGEKIRFDNAQSRADRFSHALNANIQSSRYGRPVSASNLARYKKISAAVEGNVLGTHLVAANASADLGNQTAVMTKKLGGYFSTLPPTQHLENYLYELASDKHVEANIDAILSGMKALNMRGDTDLVTNVLDKIVSSGNIRLGTHASQAIANFCMFDVKDTDVFLRRYGKYINLETARAFNEGQSRGKRKNTILSLNEYITGAYDEYDESGRLIHDSGSSKLSIAQLLMGTSLDGVERTAFENLDRRLRLAYADGTDSQGNPTWSENALKAFAKKRSEVNNAMLPAIINAALKFPSGSEQGINLASYITGLKQNADGTYSKRGEKEGDPLFGLPDEYFAEFTKTYLRAQVPSQITSLRTDTFMPIIEVLADDYITKVRAHQSDPEHNPDPAAGLPDSAQAPSSEIPDILSQEPEQILETDSPEEKERKRKSNLELAKKKKQVRDEYAKANFTSILHQNHTLGPIIRSLSSGSVNSAKKVIRDFLGVNEEDPFTVAYREELRNKRQENLRRNQQQRNNNPEEEAPESPDFTGDTPLYDEEKREELKRTYTDWSENEYTDEAQFVDKVIDDLLDLGLAREAQEFGEYFERNPFSSIRELLNILKHILDTSPNF